MAIPGAPDSGQLVAALEVVPTDEVTIVSAAGHVGRSSAATIPEQGRRTRGGNVAQLVAGDRVSEVTRSIGDPLSAHATPDSARSDSQEELFR
jgi:DNA gyrase/topoisomerase IV subunit A